MSIEQASNPDKPRLLTTSDLDARDKSITIGWSAPSSGVAKVYRIFLFDNTTQLTSKNQLSTTAVIGYYDLKNGYRYHVKISARSEAFLSSKYEWSDFYVEQFTTTVQVPSAPRDVRCNIIEVESITLKWLKPLFPNGDLVRHNIDVISNTDDYLFSTSTTEVVESHKVMRLSSGTSYRFQVYTQNVMYISSESALSQFCTTEIKLSDPPSDFQTTEVTSRNISIKWDKPIKLYSDDFFGYVIQLKENSTCVHEIVYKCLISSCQSSFELSELEDMCRSRVRNVVFVSESQLSGLQSYTFSNLMPGTTYTITAAAVNFRRVGNTVNISITTEEEAPQRPYNVLVRDVKAESISLTWDVSEPRPGKTNCTVTLTAESPAESKEFIVAGFPCRTYKAHNLEEYWNYSVTVTATTSKGSKTSYKTGIYRTLPSAPGKVSNVVTTYPGKCCTRMMISWQAPDILQQKSLIISYSFMDFPGQRRESAIVKTFDHQFSQSFCYKTVVDVLPEQSYTFEVYAINDHNMTGEKYIETKLVPIVEQSVYNSDSHTATVIVGAVLGTIIIALSIYAVYTTLVIRRYKKKEDEHEICKHLKSKGSIYADGSFMTGVADIDEQLTTGTSDNQATAENAETEYIKLDKVHGITKKLMNVLKVCEIIVSSTIKSC